MEPHRVAPIVPSGPDPEVVARIEQMQAEHRQAREAAAPARKAAILAGPELRDLEAALACMCGCHPRGPDLTLHEGGKACPCQQTPEERRAAFDKLLSLTVDIDDSVADHDDALREAGEALGLELDVAGGIAPFRLEGRCDGVRFALRARHEVYRLHVPDPLEADVDPSDPYAARWLIDSGDDEQLFDPDEPGRPARLVAAAVRRFIAQHRCAPTHKERDSRVCPDCGTELHPAETWTTPHT